MKKTPHQWWHASTPDKMPREPWIGSEATHIFASLLRKDMHVLEFGAGGSTLWLQEQVRQVVTVENKREWYEAIVSRAGHNTIVIFWEQSEPPDTYPPFDLVFIDGEPVEWRTNWIKALPRLVKPGGIVVLDNANRHEYEAERAWLGQHACLTHKVKGKGGTYTWTEFYQWRA